MVRVSGKPAKGGSKRNTGAGAVEESHQHEANGEWRPLHEQAYFRIRELLMSGRYAPGVRISLQALSNAAGFTKAPIRDATRRLIAEGALEMRSPRYLQVPIINTANLFELREIRKALEGVAVESAVRKGTNAQREQLEAITAEIETARQADDVIADMEKVRQFHATIYQIAEMPRLQRMLDTIWTITGPYMFLLYPTYVRRGFGTARRKDIIAAFRTADPEGARTALQADIGNAFDYLISLGDRYGRVAPGAPARSGR